MESRWRADGEQEEQEKGGGEGRREERVEERRGECGRMNMLLTEQTQKIRILICGAKCCMGAPRGNDFLFAPLGAGS